jgi:drug/metabolite transporter (DMT)-like permease
MPRSEPSRTLILSTWGVLALVWGSSWSVLKVGFRDIPPFAMLGARMGLAGLVCLVWVLARGGFRLPPRGERHWLGVALVGQGVAMNSLLFWGGNRLDSGLTALLFATVPLWAAATLLLLGWERVRLRSLLGIGMGLLGLAVVVLPALRGQIDLPGLGAILTAAFICGTTASIIKRHSRGWHIPSVLVVQFTLNSAFGFLMHRLAEEPALRLTPPSLAALLYLALVASVATYAGLFWLYRHMSAVSTTMLVLADASFALVLGTLWLGEPMTWRLMAAAGGVLGGFLLTLERS